MDTVILKYAFVSCIVHIGKQSGCKNDQGCVLSFILQFVTCDIGFLSFLLRENVILAYCLGCGLCCLRYFHMYTLTMKYSIYGVTSTPMSLILSTDSKNNSPSVALWTQLDTGSESPQHCLYCLISSALQSQKATMVTLWNLEYQYQLYLIILKMPMTRHNLLSNRGYLNLQS